MSPKLCNQMLHGSVKLVSQLISLSDVHDLQACFTRPIFGKKLSNT